MQAAEAAVLNAAAATGVGSKGAVATSSRPLSSGHACPRPSAYHLMQSYPSGEEDWTSDDETQFKEALVAHASHFTWASVRAFSKKKCFCVVGRPLCQLF